MIDTSSPLPETLDALHELRHGPPPPPAPPRFRLRPPLYQTVHLTGPFAGAELTMLLNPGMGLVAMLQTTTGLCARLHELVQAWNLEDQDGQPLPVSPAGVAQLEPALSAAIMTAWGEAREVSKSRG
jgi:hypothetical protein